MSACQGKLENCEICGVNTAKYTCPKCEVRSCSLTCSNIHKKELDCDGIRDKTKFLPFQSISELDVASDYCLLQEVGRCVDKCNRDPLKRCATINNFLPIFLRKLKHAAFKRGVILEFLPRSFSKNKENSTRFMWNKNELLWRIDWIFPQGENVKWTTAKASERAKLSVLLENVLEPEIKIGEDADVASSKSTLRKKLQIYRSTGLSGIKVLMKAEKVQKSSSKFYELDLNLTLAENLEQKTIIEYPVFYVILSQNADMYEIIICDEVEGRFPHRNKFKANRDSNEKRETQPINFLFHTEFTDSEDEKGKIEKEKNAKMQGRKRKFNKFQKEHTQRKAMKTENPVNKFKEISKSGPVTKNEKNPENADLQEVKFLELASSNKTCEVENLNLNDLDKFHITDSEDEGPVETPIQRLSIDENKIEKKDESTVENKTEESSVAIPSVAMNYFSAYMSDSEEEIISENNSNCGNSGLQIPDYNVLVKLNQ